MKRLLLVTSMLWAVASGSLAQDESEPDADVRARASNHFQQGVQLFQEGAYRAALVELKRAYATLPDFRVKFNIAQTQLMLGDYLQAHKAFASYLESGGSLEVKSDPPAPITAEMFEGFEGETDPEIVVEALGLTITHTK